MVEDELYHYRLDSNLHEGCCATKASRFNLFGPEATKETKDLIQIGVQVKDNIWGVGN